MTAQARQKLAPRPMNGVSHEMNGVRHEANGARHEVNGVIAIHAPEEQTAPLVLSSPHSGVRYEAAFLAASRLDDLALRRSEDSFVDEIFGGAPGHGAPLLCALFPRAFLDPNREPYELDPEMFSDSLPAFAKTRSDRVRAGFGTIARVVANGSEIYKEKLVFSEAEERIRTLYVPYHDTLKQLVDETRRRFGFAVLLDCHSMPSVGGPTDKDRGQRRPDFVLGDRFGTSCAPAVMEHAEAIFTDLGFNVARNDPYAGAHTTAHYGQPDAGVHAIQIEVSRGLYMDEDAFTRSSGLPPLTEAMSRFVAAMAGLDLNHLA